MKFKDSNSSLKIEKFEDMGLASGLLNGLKKMQVQIPTPIQSEAIPIALSGSDLIGVAQTGSGKTLTYALSVMTLLQKNPESRALILSTSRETTEQVYRVFLTLCEDLPFTISLAVAGTPVNTQVSQLKKNPRIIVATPGRMSEHLQNNKLLLKGLSILVLDEAERMMDLGFEKQLKFIQNTLRGNRQTLMFAATFGPKAEAVAQLFMNPETVLVRAANAEKPVDTLSQKVYFLSEAQKNNRLLDEIKKMQGGVIIFADSIQTCSSLGRLLEHHQFSSDFVHGDMNPGHRNRVLREFREEKIQFLITTDLLARGLDVAHVNHIVNYELPYKSEDFLHRIGRTARVGRKGNAITFITPSDGRTYRKIKSYLQGAVEETLSSNFKFEERDDK